MINRARNRPKTSPDPGTFSDRAKAEKYWQISNGGKRCFRGNCMAVLDQPRFAALDYNFSSEWLQQSKTKCLIFAA